MTAKEYLLQIKLIDAKMKAIDAEVQRLRTELLTLDDISLHASWPDGQPHGTATTDPTGTKAAELADRYNKKRDELKAQLLEYEYKQLSVRSELWSKRAEILETLQKVKTAELYTILERYYVGGERFESIAVDMHYSYKYIIDLHGIALQQIDKIINS